RALGSPCQGEEQRPCHPPAGERRLRRPERPPIITPPSHSFDVMTQRALCSAGGGAERHSFANRRAGSEEAQVRAVPVPRDRVRAAAPGAWTPLARRRRNRAPPPRPADDGAEVPR